MSQSFLRVSVEAVRVEADRIVSVALCPASTDIALPPFDAGSHIDLHLPNGLTRSYSLCNDPAETQRYVIAVLNERASRGGSRFVHAELRVGATISISPPRNSFRLDETARDTVLIAGGIGITPILAMLRRLRTLGRRPHVLFCARSRTEAAFVTDVSELTGGAAHLHFDAQAGGPPDLKAWLSAFHPDAHFYCCGPAPMLAAYEQACAALGYQHVHHERFSAPVAPPDPEEQQAFEVELARTGRTLHVPPDKSILRVLLDAGIEADYSCEQGICGTCETKVLAGDVDHRDSVLSDAERAATKAMMICVSRCRSARLVLDR